LGFLRILLLFYRSIYLSTLFNGVIEWQAAIAFPIVASAVFSINAVEKDSKTSGGLL